MRFGFNLLLWATHVTDEHMPIIEDLKATGYDGVEVPMFEGDPEHFRRLGQRLKDVGLVGQGVGMGLETARRILRLMHGEIEVTSRPGRTEFRVSLPIAERPPSAAVPRAATE